MAEERVPPLRRQLRRLRSNDHFWVAHEMTVCRGAKCADSRRVSPWVYPVVLGKGIRLFEEGAPPFRLNQVESRSTSKGILLNTYRGLLPDMSAQPDNLPAQSRHDTKSGCRGYNGRIIEPFVCD